MPYGRRMTSPVKTDKHEIVWRDLAIDAGTTVRRVIGTGVDVGSKTINTDISVGAHVRWIYFEINFAAQTTTNPKTVDWQVVWEAPGVTHNVPNLMYQDDRSYVLKRGLEMLPSDVATVYKRIFVVKIPRSYQRIKQGVDIIFQYIASSTEAINVCGFAIYKEIY